MVQAQWTKTEIISGVSGNAGLKGEVFDCLKEKGD